MGSNGVSPYPTHIVTAVGRDLIEDRSD